MADYSFHTFSYFSGLISGLILKWTDIVPILGGFILGVSIRKVPEMFNPEDIPLYVTQYFQYYKELYNKKKNNKK